MWTRAVSRALFRSLATTTSKSQLKLQDVVIIGGGPAGLSLLAALKKSTYTKHLKCTLVDAADVEKSRSFAVNPPENYSNRVISLTPLSKEFMQENIGNWFFLNQDRIKDYNRIVCYDSNDRSNSITFNSEEYGTGQLATMCELANIQSSLLGKIDDLNANLDEPEVEQTADIIDKVTVLDILLPNKGAGEVSLDKGLERRDLDIDWPIVVLSNGDKIQTRLLVGADGFKSVVRDFSGIPSRGWSYNRFGVVANIELQYEDTPSTAWQRFLTTGPLAILPLTENQATIVWSTTPELSELLLRVNETIFPSLVTAAMVLDEINLNYIYQMLRKNPDDMTVLDEISWCLSRLSEIDIEENYPVQSTKLFPESRARFPLKMAHADTYNVPRVALIGDAAHSIHPLAGQGLNMGQSDVVTLLSVLETSCMRGLDIGSTLVLDYYTVKAWPSNNALIGVCDKLHKIFSTDWYPLVFARGLGMKSIDFLDSVKKLMIKTVSGK